MVKNKRISASADEGEGVGGVPLPLGCAPRKISAIADACRRVLAYHLTQNLLLLYTRMAALQPEN
jgi:hypothetical protein